MKRRPLVSVCMPVYNRESYIRDCIDSVLTQSLTNFEFIIVDDGSTDNTRTIIENYKDPRIRLICNIHDYIGSCNIMLKEAKGKYIARIDSDDMMMPNRLQNQVDYLERNPDVSVLGTGIYIVRDNEKSYSTAFVSDLTLDYMYKNGSGIANPSTMMRRLDIVSNGIEYEREYIYAEDFCFWAKCLMNGLKIRNIQDYLTKYRISDTQISTTKSFLQYKATNRVKTLISRWLSREEENWALTHPVNIPFSRNLLTVIIPFLNEKEEVKETVRSIRKYVGNEVDIIVINDQSNDDYNYREDLQNLNVHYIYNIERKGVAGSRDLGVSICKTPYFLLLDAHMRFYNDLWLDKICTILSENDRCLVCCQTKFLSKTNGVVSESTECPTTYGAVFNAKNLSYIDWSYVEKKYNSSVEQIDFVLGACYAASTRYWTYLDGLKGLTYYGNDEAFISLKVWLEGGKCLLLKDIVIGHIYRNSSPYKRYNEEELYNHLFIANMLFPKSLSCKIYARALVNTPFLFYIAYKLLEERKNENTLLKNSFRKKITIPFHHIIKTEMPISKEQIKEAQKILERTEEYALFLMNNQISDLGIYHGKMAQLIWFLHFGTKYNNSHWNQYAQNLWNEIEDAIEKRIVCWNFKYGLSGIGWGILYLYKNGLIDEIPCETIKAIDKELLVYNPNNTNDDSFELGNGGFLAYVILREQIHLLSPFSNYDYSKSAHNIITNRKDVISCRYAYWYLTQKESKKQEEYAPSVFDWNRINLFLPQDNKFWDGSIYNGCVSAFLYASKIEINKERR